MRTYSLAPTVDLEAQRLGLQSWEVINLIEASIQRRYMRQGRTVYVRVDPASESEPLHAIEAKEGLSGLVWIPVTDIRPPNPEALQREIEQYVRSKESAKRWWLAQCKILSIETDHYLVEMVGSDESALIGKTAVLPANRTSARNGLLEKGETVWAVIKAKSGAQFDGGEFWHAVQSDYVASRTDSIFLRMLLKKYWHLDVIADISSGAGLVVAPTGTEIGQVIGPNGSHIDKLKQLTGLSRIVVIRSVEGKRPDLRLSGAVRQIVNIDGVRVRPPKKDTEEWRLFVRAKDAKILIGTNGTNLRFIAFASGLRLQHFVREGM
jgi:hypothetical protein